MKTRHLYRTLPALLAALCLLLCAAGCGKTAPAAESKEQETAVTETETTVTAEKESAEETASEEAALESSDAEASESSAASDNKAADEAAADDVLVRVGSLKGPTTMGLVHLMNDAESGNVSGSYSFVMSAQPTEVLASVVSGDLDIALVPANLASTIYNRMEGGVAALNINTLGVLYCITGDASVASIQDLAGRTVVMTGQGATPEYALRYLIDAWQVPDVTLDFRSEATEVASVLSNDPNQVAVLPQPFVTVAEQQNEALKTAFSLGDAWSELNNGSALVTGVTIVRRAFLEEHPDAVKQFMQDQAESAKKAEADVEGTAELVARYGIIEKAPIAAKALPYCGIACIAAEDGMQPMLSGYLETLFNQDPSSIGGAMPADDFYYQP